MKHEFVNDQHTCRGTGRAIWKGCRAIVAFTLIELLAVIAIIGLLAGLVVGLSGLATTKSRLSRLGSEHQRLVTGIESFKQSMNAYPQDNAQLTNGNLSVDRLHEYAGKNLLYYELGGAMFVKDDARGVPAQFRPVGKGSNETVFPSQLRTIFGVGGIENSGRSEREVTYRGFSFRPAQYDRLDHAAGTNVNVLTVPLKGPHELDGWREGKTGAGFKTKINPWFYDATSTNRHNLDSYDLWTEYLNAKRTNVIKNWMTTTRPGIPSNE